MRTVNIRAFKDRLETEETMIERLCEGENVCLVFFIPEALRGIISIIYGFPRYSRQNAGEYR